MVFMIILCLILLILLIGVSYFALKLAKIIFRLEDQIEESLDIIDSCYSRISEASETQVFSDEPLVKNFMNDLSMSRDALLLIANKIVLFSDGIGERANDKTKKA